MPRHPADIPVRWHVTDLFGAALPARMVTVNRGPEDPGYSTYENLDSLNVWRVRDRIVATILDAQKGTR